MRILVHGTPVVDAYNTWRGGVISGDLIEPASRIAEYQVVYDNDPYRKPYKRCRKDILSADDLYIDPDGIRMAPMAFPEAVRWIHAMAQNRVEGPDRTLSRSEWLITALETVRTLVRHTGASADFGPRPVTARTWSESVVGNDTSLDPGVPSEALRICIAAAREFDLSRADRRMMRQAVSVAEDLVALYPAKLDEFRAVPAFQGP